MGMTTDVLRNIFKKPFTLDYPKKKTKVSVHFRGNIYVDKPTCIGCYLCQVNCPTGAIVVNKKTKKAEVDLGLCILCGLCNDVCPVKCIYFPSEFENAVTKRDRLKPNKRQQVKPGRLRSEKVKK